MEYLYWIGMVSLNYSSTFIDQKDRLLALNYYCIAEDLNGLIWTRTDNGIVYFSSFGQAKKWICCRGYLGEYTGIKNILYWKDKEFLQLLLTEKDRK